MAVTPYNFLNDAGVQTLAEFLLKAGNTRIKERIATAIAAASYSDDNHVLSAKAILGLIGNINNYASMDGTGNTVLDKVAALRDAIGTSTDTSDDDTVYGEIATVRSEILALSHLTYQVVEGDIETEVPTAAARTDVIYLQHDEPAYSVGLDGYLLDSNGDHATANDGTSDYEAWMDSTDGKIYKMVSGVKGSELSSDDAIFANVALVADNTYNLYIAQPTGYKKNANNFLVKADGTTLATYVAGGTTYYAYWDGTAEAWKLSTSSSSYVPTDPETVITESHLIFREAGMVDVNWLCVGDTSLELDNYWSKSDADVVSLRTKMFSAMTSNAIESAVHTAFDNTDPYDGSTSYVDSWLESNP